MGSIGNTAALVAPPAQPTPSAAPVGHAPLVEFSGKESTPPSAAYIGPDDSLQIQFFPSVGPMTAVLEVRFMRPDGTIAPWEESIVLPTAYAPVTFNRRLAEGYILSASLSIPGAGAMRGQCWAQINILRGFPPAGTFSYTLIQGYIGLRSAIFWPYGPQYTPTDGAGFLVTFDITPGAGADWIFTSTVATRNRVIGVLGFLTTSATVANRQVFIEIDDSLLQRSYTVAAPAVQAASLISNYAAGPGVPTQGTVATGQTLSLPVQTILPANAQLRARTTNLQAGDAWSNVKIAVEQWVDI